MAPEVVLRGRDQERAAVLDLLDTTRAGRGSALVISGGPGSGKTSLLRLAHSADFRVLTAHGVPAESALELAGLHRLLHPLADRVPESLRVAIGLAPGPPHRTFALNAEVHRLVCAVAAQRPVLVLVDDSHLLDRPSLEALAFLARRVTDHRVAVLFALEPHRGDDALAGLPGLPLRPLDDPAALALLADHNPLGVSEDFAEEVLDLAGGNPLALTELARTGQLPPDSALRSRLRSRFHT